MLLKSLRILGMVCLGTGTLLAQGQEINGDLLNLYQLTLAKSPTVKRQQIQTGIAEAARQTARSQFDYHLASDLSLSRGGYNLLNADPRRSIAGNEINTNDLLLSAQLQRTFRSGTMASIGLNYQRVADSYPFTAFNEEVGAFFADNSTGTSLSISHPLLRGRGQDIVTAGETLAELGWERQQGNAVFVTSQQLLRTLSAYWQYRGASESYEVYQANEARVRSVLQMTRELVAADKKPTGDLTQVQADLIDKERQTIIAGQSLYNAQQNLGRSLGLETEASTQISPPLSIFPALDTTEAPPTLNELLEIARANRADLRALSKQLEQQSTQLEVAQNNLRPQLNANAFANYGGAAMGNGLDRFVRALANDEGRNYQVGVGLNYTFPLNNNQAEAAMLRTQLEMADIETFYQDQIRNIELNVSIAYNNYLNSVEAVKKANQSLKYYEEVFENEQFKFQNGLTTLLNLILLQERLTFAQLEFIQAQQQYAIAIGNLRFETGTLFTGNEISTNGQAVDPTIFYSLPRR